jgi:predicted phage tail protein
LRRDTGSDKYETHATVSEHQWVDPTSEFGKSYSYMIQELVDLGGGKEAESELAEPVAITPVDTFPPAVPAGLRAAAAPASIELSWDRDTEADLAGYRVYRAEGGGEFARIAEVSAIPTYSDRAIEHGKTYRYAVSAVDQVGNESRRSDPVEVSAP